MNETDLARRVQELSDHREVSELVSRYALLLDERRVDEGLTVFTADVVMDYPGVGGFHFEGVDEVIAQVSGDLSQYAAVQHVITNVIVDLDGDSARVHAILAATQLLRADDLAATRHGGGRYVFEARRTDDGWRISRVAIELVWLSRDPVDDSAAA